MQSKRLDEAHVKGTSKHGIITKGDVLQFIASGSRQLSTVTAAPQTQTSSVRLASTNASNSFKLIDPNITNYKDTPNNNIRKVIAKRLTQSKQSVPHFYCTIES